MFTDSLYARYALGLGDIVAVDQCDIVAVDQCDIVAVDQWIEQFRESDQPDQKEQSY